MDEWQQEERWVVELHAMADVHTPDGQVAVHVADIGRRLRLLGPCLRRQPPKELKLCGSCMHIWRHAATASLHFLTAFALTE